MTVMVPGSIGERIAAHRRRRGLSQAALAGLIGRSESWVSQVERGTRRADRLSTILDLARVLRVDVGALTGQSWTSAVSTVPTRFDLTAVRAEFAGYHYLVGEDAAAGPEIDPAGAHRLYQAARYAELIDVLPALLRRADHLHRSGPAYLASYLVAAKLLTKIGVADLAMLAADRCANAAAGDGSPEQQGVAAYQVVCALLAGGRTTEADRLALAMATKLQEGSAAGHPARLSVSGSLWLIGAVTAARRADQQDALRRLAAAQSLADRLGADANHAWTAFGPTNVAVHRVSVAAELGDVAGALEAAAKLRVDALPPGLDSRRVQVHLDLARVLVRRKRDAEAILQLRDAEAVVPDVVRHSRVARELVHTMLGRDKRSRFRSLAELAQRSGVVG